MLIRTLNNEAIASYMGQDGRFRSYSDGETIITIVFVLGIPMTVRLFAQYMGMHLTQVVKAAGPLDREEIKALWDMGIEIPKDATTQFAYEPDLEPFERDDELRTDGTRPIDICQNAVAFLLKKLQEESEGGLTALKKTMRDLDDAAEISVIELSPTDMAQFPEPISRIWL